jgi:hypothetical protein
LAPSQVNDRSLLAQRYRLVEPFFVFVFSPSATLLCYRILGTLAAGIQSGIGNVVAGSLFAGAQSTAMGVGVPVLGKAIGGAVSGVVGIIAAL